MGQLANRKLTIQSSSTSDMQLAMLKNVETAEDTADRMLEITNWTVSRYFSHDRKPCENSIRNQKYSMLTFIPKVLYQQFKYFFNLFYLLTALSQFVPALKVGLMFSFVAPLLLVLTLTMLK